MNDTQITRCEICQTRVEWEHTYNCHHCNKIVCKNCYVGGIKCCIECINKPDVIFNNLYYSLRKMFEVDTWSNKSESVYFNVPSSDRKIRLSTHAPAYESSSECFNILVGTKSPDCDVYILSGCKTEKEYDNIVKKIIKKYKENTNDQLCLI